MAEPFDDKKILDQKDPEVFEGALAELPEIIINASGHKQELDRNFSFFAICGLAITSGNVWVALGGSLTVAIYDGGPPGVLYEFLVVSFFYWLVAASVAELASAMPSSGGVYHWASITAGKYGRVGGWFAGWWNFFAWIFAYASTTQIAAAQLVSMYAVSHPAFVMQRWHVFVTYLIINWMACFCMLYANRILPVMEKAGVFFIVAGVAITIIVCAAMPPVHATNAFVWREWTNSSGYSSNGFVFLLGMLNGAFGVGTPDIVTHLAEEIPKSDSSNPCSLVERFAKYPLGQVRISPKLYWPNSSSASSPASSTSSVCFTASLISTTSSIALISSPSPPSIGKRRVRPQEPSAFWLSSPYLLCSH